jgi:hypothetical protein
LKGRSDQPHDFHFKYSVDNGVKRNAFVVGFGKMLSVECRKTAVNFFRCRPIQSGVKRYFVDFQ